jgi:exonuclease VII small subunit
MRCSNSWPRCIRTLPHLRCSEKGRRSCSETEEEAEGRLEAIRQQRAGSQRALDRYFAAFEGGSLTPAECKERVATLRQRLDSFTAEEASLIRQST